MPSCFEWLSFIPFSSLPSSRVVFGVYNFNGTIRKLRNRRWKTEYRKDCCKAIWHSLVQCSMSTYVLDVLLLPVCLRNLAATVVVTEELRYTYLDTHSFIWRNFFFTDYDYLAGGKYTNPNTKQKTWKSIQLQNVTRANVYISKTKITKKEREREGEKKIGKRLSIATALNHNVNGWFFSLMPKP